ncbi:hypothetical protein QR680_015351 [Steinernema hermaphroditum]|uniref:C2H2-type domain-containing protein n=1 Tax=Steinernema hermaphroditum TaxID=289476 RepID=A0AA39LK30_9BILA|nr:hypothetical protein QR680_015351 [Steinernema hermaphroditum]
MTLRYQEDPGLLHVSVNPPMGVRDVQKYYADASNEVRHLLDAEVNVILECKCCRNLFRSMLALVTHKRTICRRFHESSFTAEKCQELIEGINGIFDETMKPSKRRSVAGKRVNLVSMVNKRLEMIRLAKGVEVPTLPILARSTPETFFINGVNEVLHRDVKEETPEKPSSSLVVFPSITTSKCGEMTLRNRRKPGTEVERPKIMNSKLISLMDKAQLYYGHIVDIGTLTCQHGECTYTLRPFPSLSALIAHLHEHSAPLPDGNHLCILCDEKYASMQKLIDHLKSEHDYNPDDVDKKPVKKTASPELQVPAVESVRSTPAPSASPARKRPRSASPERATRPSRIRQQPKWLKEEVYETKPIVQIVKEKTPEASSSLTDEIEVNVELEETKSDLGSPSNENELLVDDVERSASLQPEGSPKVFCRRQSFEQREKEVIVVKGSRRKQNLATLSTDSDDEGRILALPNGRRPPVPTDLEGIGVFLTGEQRDLFFAGLKSLDPTDPSSPFCCDVCDKIVSTLEAGRPHIIGHIRAVRFRCRLCGVGSFFINALRNHLLKAYCPVQRMIPQTEKEADGFFEVVDSRMPGVVKFTNGKIVSDESLIPYIPDPELERRALRNRDIDLLGTMSQAEYKATLRENFE